MDSVAVPAALQTWPGLQEEGQPLHILTLLSVLELVSLLLTSSFHCTVHLAPATIPHTVPFLCPFLPLHPQAMVNWDPVDQTVLANEQV